MQTTNKTPKAIFDLVSADARFKRFGELAKAAGLDEKLSNAKITVFAPTNEAFAQLPQDKIAAMLKPENREQLRKQVLLHVVPEVLDIDSLTKTKMVKTEAGAELKVDVSNDRKQIKLANANVVLPKEEAQNGFIYPLDAFLQPSASTAAATKI